MIDKRKLEIQGLKSSKGGGSEERRPAVVNIQNFN
jgi:hypothetical protein